MQFFSLCFLHHVGAVDYVGEYPFQNIQHKPVPQRIIYISFFFFYSLYRGSDCGSMSR